MWQGARQPERRTIRSAQGVQGRSQGFTEHRPEARDRCSREIPWSTSLLLPTSCDLFSLAREAVIRSSHAGNRKRLAPFRDPRGERRSSDLCGARVPGLVLECSVRKAYGLTWGRKGSWCEPHQRNRTGFQCTRGGPLALRDSRNTISRLTKSLGESLRPGWSLHPRRFGIRLCDAPIQSQEPADTRRFGNQFDKVWVELTTCVFLKFFDRARQAHCLAVRPISSHRVDGVSDHDNTRTDRNGLTSDPVRISRPVEVLVVVLDHRFNCAPKLPSRCNKLRASHDVCPHDHHLLGS